MPIIVVIHNISNPKKLVDFAKTSFAFRTDLFIISNAIGFAESEGTSQVNQIAYKLGKSILSVGSLQEALDLFGPDTLYLIEKTKKSVAFNPDAISEELKLEKTIMLVFSGTEPSNLEQEIGLGTPTYLKQNIVLDPVAICAIMLFEIEKSWR